MPAFVIAGIAAIQFIHVFLSYVLNLLYSFIGSSINLQNAYFQTFSDWYLYIGIILGIIIGWIWHWNEDYKNIEIER